MTSATMRWYSLSWALRSSPEMLEIPDMMIAKDWTCPLLSSAHGILLMGLVFIGKAATCKGVAKHEHLLPKGGGLPTSGLWRIDTSVLEIFIVAA
jgi:hypothetical protein